MVSKIFTGKEVYQVIFGSFQSLGVRESTYKNIYFILSYFISYSEPIKIGEGHFHMFSSVNKRLQKYFRKMYIQRNREISEIFVHRIR